MRPLNDTEKEIIKFDFGNAPKIIGVEYERIAPRATLCTIYVENKFLFFPLNPIKIHGVAIRHENDVEDAKIGEAWSFTRAVKLYLKKYPPRHNA